MWAASATQVTRTQFGNAALSVCYTNDPERVNSWLDEHCPPMAEGEELTPGSYELLGLDVEWKPVWKVAGTRTHFPKIALLQLSTAWGDVLLYHVHHAPEELPASLGRVLASKRVLKVGVGILDDIMKIHTKWRIKTAAYLDLDALCKQQERELGLPLGPAGSGLLAYAQHFLTGCRTWKNKKITTSNWEQWPLSPRQRAYAAMDANAGAAVFIKMGLLEKVVHRMVHTF